jgi:uncharacterized protein (TIGR02271 family)
MTQLDVSTLPGTTVVDGSGGKIGKVAQVYLDDRTGQPQWVTVKTGLFGTKESFVPLSASRLDADRLVVDISKDQVSGAPRVDEDGHISEQEEAEIYRYYGLSGSGGGADRGTETMTGTAPDGYATPERVSAHESTDRTTGYEGSAGHDTSGPNTDDAMTRSEERLVAGTQTTETGKARLRKYVVTETHQVDVPVSHEEVRLQREPITDANRDSAYSGGDITEEEHEVTLRAEKPVVGTATEAVERVRLGKETVSDTETVSGEVRKEQIDLDDPTGTARNPRG